MAHVEGTHDTRHLVADLEYPGEVAAGDVDADVWLLLCALHVPGHHHLRARLAAQQRVAGVVYTSLHCTALTALLRTALHCTALHCTALHCNELHCTAQCRTLFHYITLCFTVTALYFTVHYSIVNVIHSFTIYFTALRYIVLYCLHSFALF